MADVVLPGARVNPKPDEDQINEDADRDPLAEGGGEVEYLDAVRSETGTGNDDPQPQVLHTAQDLTKDALED